MNKLWKWLCKIGHKWEYQDYLDGAYKARGCLRCDRREAQVGKSTWQYVATDWKQFKANPPDWDALREKLKSALDEEQIKKILLQNLEEATKKSVRYANRVLR